MKQWVMEQARSLGFDDCAFVDVQPFTQWRAQAVKEQTGEASMLADNARLWMPQAQSILVLFRGYQPAAAYDGPQYVRYYIESQHAYWGAKQLAVRLQRAGLAVLHTSKLPAMAAALRAGGRYGDHGLYIHPRLGSFLHIELLLTELAPDPRKQAEDCLHCGACQRACPTGALAERDTSLCIRHGMDMKPMPEWMRTKVETLFGCERCQLACPLNRPIQYAQTARTEATLLQLRSLVKGDRKPLKTLLGANYATRTRLMSQAALYIGARRRMEEADLLEDICQSGLEPAGTYAQWAKQRLSLPGVDESNQK